MGNFSAFLAFRHIRRRPLQSILTILGVAVGVMALVTALSLTNGFIDELISSTLKATPHVTLVPFDGSPMEFDEGQQGAIAFREDVKAVSPFLNTQGLISRRANANLGISGRQGFVQLTGIDPDIATDIYSLDTLEEQKEIGFAIAYCDNDQSEERENFIGSVPIKGKNKNRGWIDAGVFEKFILLK